MIKLIIFDWDGTLIDSADKIVGAMQRATADVGLPARSDVDVRNIIGLALPEAIATLFPAETAVVREAVRSAYIDHFVAADTEPCSLFPMAAETLAGLRLRGCRLAVATSKSRRGLERGLAQTGWEQMFDATRCADETRSKPHPQMLEELLAAFDARSETAVMIGDTEYDMAMARSAGVARIGVSHGAHAPERLLAYAPLRVIDRLDELLAWQEALHDAATTLSTAEDGVI